MPSVYHFDPRDAVSLFKYLQRFEHKTADKSSARKIDTKIKFPATLDMARYTTSMMKEIEKENVNSYTKIDDGNS